MILKSALALVVVLATQTLAQAQSCRVPMTEGRYRVTCDGYLTPAPGAPMVPAKILAVATIFDDGSITATGTASIGGQVANNTLEGKEQVNRDCTGTVAYTQKFNGQPGPPLNATFIVSEHGDRIDGLIVDQGAAMSCVLVRISPNTTASASPKASPEAKTDVAAVARLTPSAGKDSSAPAGR